MVITCDNTFVIIACENKSVHVKSLITGSDLHELAGHNSSVTALAASADCERIYVACADSKLYLYDVRTKELIAVLIEQESSINDLRISADNSFLFSSSGVTNLEFLFLNYSTNLYLYSSIICLEFVVCAQFEKEKVHIKAENKRTKRPAQLHKGVFHVQRGRHGHNRHGLGSSLPLESARW